ncbi:YheC/YheD family endospore coat-associated protein [Paenibacillus sp. y28]|uniref:YheC/YheD family endospore coat-associated protein n=1 Tax=Paenibacillus sp. y28 TaxID=3129110 RepID=UPI003016341B
MELTNSDAAKKTVIAILTMDDDNRKFRGNHNNFIDLIRAGQESGATVFVVTVKHLKLTQKRVMGYVYDFNAKSWMPQWMPLPNVIYNRIPLRKDEMQQEVQQIITACTRHRSIKLFNPTFFNKWTLYEWLNKAKTTKKYIPTTQKLSSRGDLKALLSVHSALYLKPERGKAGKGIMRIDREIQKLKRRTQYSLTIQEEKNSQTLRYKELDGLWTNLKQVVGDEEYIVQQGIPLSVYKNRPFDLRVLVQKNSKGLWDLSGIGARLAGKSSITTHVPRGGSIDDPEKLLAFSFGTLPAKRLIQRIKKASLSIARQIEKKSGYLLGEMSMDLGVDRGGNIWFFEANSKPMKFDEPHIRKKSLERLIQFSTYLTNKQGRSGGQSS